VKVFITGSITVPSGLNDNREGRHEDERREKQVLRDLSAFTGQPMHKVIKNRVYTFGGLEQYARTGWCWSNFTYQTRDFGTPCSSTQNKVRLHILSIDLMLEAPSDDVNCVLCMAGALVGQFVDTLGNKGGRALSNCHFQACPIKDGQMNEFTLDRPNMVFFSLVDQRMMKWGGGVAGDEMICPDGEMDGSCTRFQ
jgi:hypothetical protein